MNHKQKGLSLIELMIALVISSFLMLGVFQIYLTSHRTDQVTHSLSRIQENGRLGMDILGRHLRMAGSQGDSGDDEPLSDGIQGFEEDSIAWSAVLVRPAELAAINNVRAGTDIVYVQYIDENNNAVELAFYVKDTGRNNGAGGNIFSLYQFDVINAAEEELLEGIEQLQLLYVQRLASGNIRFVPADDASIDFSQVIGARASILVTGTRTILPEDDTKTYALAGAEVPVAGTVGAETTHAADRNLRKVFTSTTYLRNLD